MNPSFRVALRRRASGFWSATFLSANLVVASAAVGGERSDGYPSPRAAGFHHCALIYYRAQRTAADLLPYVAEVEDGEPADWLFDSFLFLIYGGLPSGQNPMTGDTTLADWR